MFANCPMQEGGIKFTVTAVAEGKASSVSETFVYDRKLDAVGQILYDEDTQTFYWDAVANATKYYITVNVGGKDYNLKKAFTFVSGKCHKFTVTVSKTRNGINVNIDGWETDGTDNGGVAE